MKKRGVSAVIAAVLLILITVAAVSILWAFVIPMIEQSAMFNEPVSLEILQEGYTAWDPENKLSEIQVKRGSDNADIYGFDFVFVFGGNSYTHPVRQEIGLNSKTVYYFNFSEFEGNLEEVKIYPVYKGERKGDVVSFLRINNFEQRDLSSTGKTYVNILCPVKRC
jgi:flagellin-like protein